MRVTREEAIRSLRQRKVYEKKLKAHETAESIMAICSFLGLYALLMAIG